jgi:hypothetical protein
VAPYIPSKEALRAVGMAFVTKVRQGAAGSKPGIK